MTLADILVILLACHFVADWLLQPDYLAKNKSKRAMPLLIHCVQYTAMMYVFAGVFGVELSLNSTLVIFITHVIFDDYKVHVWWCETIKGMEEPPLWMLICVDQIWHFLTLFGIAYYMR